MYHYHQQIDIDWENDKDPYVKSHSKMIDKLNIQEIKPSSRRYPAIIFEQEREAIVGSIESNREDEVKKLGDNAEERIQATALFAQKFFPENLMPAIERLTETSEGIQAIEHIMESIKQGGNIDTEPANRLDLQTLESMMNDERYWNPAKKDLNYIREVTEGYNKLNGVG